MDIIVFLFHLYKVESSPTIPMWHLFPIKPLCLYLANEAVSKGTQSMQSSIMDFVFFLFHVMDAFRLKSTIKYQLSSMLSHMHVHINNVNSCRGDGVSLLTASLIFFQPCRPPVQPGQWPLPVLLLHAVHLQLHHQHHLPPRQGHRYRGWCPHG